jgi:hypothetical protein
MDIPLPNDPLDRELDAIVNLYQTINYAKASLTVKKSLPPNELFNITKEISNYIDHVIDNYRTEHLDRNYRNTGNEILERIGINIGLLSSKGIIKDPLIDQLFRSLSEALDVRGDRILHSKQRIPGIMRLVAVVSSFIWLLSFFGLVIQDTLVSIALVGGTTFVIIMVLGIVNDLDNPFDGTWNVNVDDWISFRESLQKK